jgi:hypothetical protein
MPTVPKIFELNMTPRVFRALSSGGSTGREPSATIVSFRLLSAITVTFAIERQLQGHLHGRACNARTKRTRHGKSCTRFVQLPGSFAIQGRAGENNFGFTGRLGGQRLAHGHYRLVALAHNSIGALVPIARIAFRVR